MHTYRIEFEVEIPEVIQSYEVEEWAKFLLCGGGLPMDHPLVDEDFDADFGSVTVKKI